MSINEQEFSRINKLIHEPARMSILAVLAGIDRADFKFLLNSTGLTKGNLSRHLQKLEDAGYVEISKGFVGKIPQTTVEMTKMGKKEFNAYLKHIKSMMKKMPSG